MNQILHIFRKDTYRFWPEILLSLAATGAFTLIEPYQWQMVQDQLSGSPLRSLSQFAPLVVAMAWGILITRVIHAEGLVNQNEFWITRPYQRPKLLAGKLLFSAIWICLPFLAAQLFLLAEGRFHPLSYLPLLLLNLFFELAFLLLPLLALATVTSTFARMTLTVVGVLLLIPAFGLFLHVVQGYSPWVPYPDWPLAPISICLCAAAIAVQYATRRTWVARALLVALPIVLGSVVMAYQSQRLVDRAYPQPPPGSNSPLSVTLVPDSHRPAEARLYGGQDYLDLPVRYSQVVAGEAVEVNNFRFSLTSADGSQWTSPWQGLNNDYVSGYRASTLSLMLSPKVFDRFKSRPVNLEITFAISRLQAGPVTRMALPDQDFAAPGIGFCTPSINRSSHSLTTTLLCRSAVQSPPVTHVIATWSSAPCANSAQPLDNSGEAEAWMGDLRPAYGFVFTSVVTPHLFFSSRRKKDDPEDAIAHWHLCPGSPIAFTPYSLLARTQTKLTIANFQFPLMSQ